MARRSARLSAGGVDSVDESVPESAPACDSQTDTKTFRLLDLPAELRNHIYSYTLADKRARNYNLARLRYPAITLVSKQLRSESVPIFFSECHFIIAVGSNYLDASSWRKAGNLGLQHGVRQCLHKLKKAAVFRHVTFRVFPYHEIRSIREELGHKTWDRSELTTFEIATHPTFSTALVDGPSGIARFRKFPYASRPWARDRADQMALSNQTAEELAQEMPNREEFKGLTLSDLDKIAKCFRVKLDATTQKMVCG